MQLQYRLHRSRERGVTAIEYGIIAALVAVVAITGVGAAGGSLSGVYANVASALGHTAGTPGGDPTGTPGGDPTGDPTGEPTEEPLPDGTLWLPSAWLAASTGSVTEARGYLTGEGGSVSVIGGGSVPADSPSTGAPRAEMAERWIDSVAFGADGHSFTATWHASGTDGTYALPQPEVTCMLPDSTTFLATWGQNGTYYEWDSARHAAPVAPVAGTKWCKAESKVYKVRWYDDGMPSWANWTHGATFYNPDALPAHVLTTTVTCRDMVAGTDADVTADQATTAASPVCPDGTLPVRAQISEGATTLQDVGVTPATLTTYQPYLANPGPWSWKGDAATCSLQSHTKPVQNLPLDAAVCAEAASEGRLG